MTDTQNSQIGQQNSQQDSQTGEIQGTAPQKITQRKPMRPFGADRQHELTMKAQALATMSRQECFDRGYLTVKDLDDEELRYGRCRDESGYIPKTKNKTRLIPQDKYDEMIAEHEARFKQKLRQNLDNMLEIMVEIAEDDTVEPRDRFEAAKYIFERTAGKTPDKLDVRISAKPWETMLQQVTGIVPMSRAEHRALQGAGIVDVEVVDEREASLEDAMDSDILGPNATEHGHEPMAENQSQDTVQPSDIPQYGQDSTEQNVVQVHIPRPHERYADPNYTGDTPEPGEQYLEHVQLPVGPDVLVRTNNSREQPGPGQRVDEPDANSEPDSDTQYLDYGARRTQDKSYADQVRAAQDLAARRKEHKDRINQAKKQRKINRATGADAITTDITGATVGDDGQIRFD